MILRRGAPLAFCKWSLLLGVLAGCMSIAPLRAQQRPVQPADTSKVSPVDALRARQRQLLENLARTPGADTLELQRMDTLPRAATPARPPAQRDLAGDSVVQALLRQLPGYQPLEYTGAVATFDAVTRDLVLRGDTATKVSVEYQGELVTADDSIRYNRELVRAEGNPVYSSQQGQDPLTSRRLVVDVRNQVASAFGAKTKYSEGAQWLVTGDLPRVGRDTIYAQGASFTSDEQRIPYYHFGASHVKIVRGKVMVAMPVKLYFADVPVLWLPFVAQSLSRGRASGLLTPRFSLNDVVRNSNGYQRRISNVGFYWAINQYLDATVAGDWFSNNFTSLTTGLRFRVLKHFLAGSVNARQYWRATGGREFSLNGQQSWDMSERMNMNASIAYVSSTSLVRQYTFNPVEATQQILSSGGISRRFDWGALNILGSRSQSLSDDRVELNLPRATLSLKPITLFAAPVNRAAWFNNATWSGGGSYSRRSQDFPELEEDTARIFTFYRADQAATQFSANHSVSLSRFSVGQDVRFEEGTVRRVPLDTLSFYPFADDAPDHVDISQAKLGWSTSLSYQQTLVGQTSITPNVTISSGALRSDTVELAQNFVSEPTRVSFGASIRSQAYGFFPGFGPFQTIRHRISPGVSYNWAPEVEPTDLQRRVFGSRTSQPVSQLTFSFSQTFEAKRHPPSAADSAAARAAAATLPPPLPPALPGALSPTPFDSAAARLSPTGQEPLGPGNPTRRAQGQTVTLLSLSTSSIQYDFVEADSAGGFIHGFMSSTLRNDISSDYLRGLGLSIEHNLFRDSTFTPLGGGRQVRLRTFAPRLSAVNLRFSLSSNSSIVRWLGLGASDAAAAADTPFDPAQDPFADNRGVSDEASIIPGLRSQTELQNQRTAAGQRRDWSASVSYALTRPSASRIPEFDQSSQNITASFNASPTRNWRMSWRTSYDLDGGGFNHHMVNLTRDLHRWQANFDFMKTATGNWQFRFEVSLLDASDLHFDYDQRSVTDTPNLR